MSRRLTVQREPSKPGRRLSGRTTPPVEQASGVRLPDKRPRNLRGCPKCGQSKNLGEIDLIPGVALGYFDEEGEWTFWGETKIHWDDQKAEHDPAQFVCFSCDTVFDLSGKIY